jgi:hypothetical protein
MTGKAVALREESRRCPIHQPDCSHGSLSNLSNSYGIRRNPCAPGVSQQDETIIQPEVLESQGCEHIISTPVILTIRREDFFNEFIA